MGCRLKPALKGFQSCCCQNLGFIVIGRVNSLTATIGVPSWNVSDDLAACLRRIDLRSGVSMQLFMGFWVKPHARNTPNGVRLGSHSDPEMLT